MNTPNIIRESSAGFFGTTLLDEMFRKRQVICNGQITAENADAIIAQLLHLHDEDPSTEITMYINSPGGEVPAGLAIYDAMKAISCPIRTVCTSLAASMGAIIFSSGDKREMLPHAKVMIHDPSSAGWINMPALKLDSSAKDLMRTREVLGNILAENTKRSLEEIYAKTAADTYFSAQEAVDFGLADEVVYHLGGQHYVK